MRIDFEKILDICLKIKDVVEEIGVEVTIVVGVGNFLVEDLISIWIVAHLII